MDGQSNGEGGRPRADLDTLVQDIVQRVLDVERRRGGARFSERSYSDQPILRKGSDWRREREERHAGAERSTPTGRPDSVAHPISGGRPDSVAHPAGAGQPASAERSLGAQRTTADRPRRERSIASTRAERARRAYQSQARFDQQPLPRDAARALPHSTLPPTLTRLRDLESSYDEHGALLRGSRLFAAQARLVADFEDNLPYQGTLPFRYLPTYQELSDRELRGYFSWRALWRRDEASDAPSTFARLLAYELVNGVGTEPDAPIALELRRLVDFCQDQTAEQPGTAEGIVLDLERLLRDYVVCHQLDPKLATSEEERDFARSVMTLRRAERARLCEEGLRGLSPADQEGPTPTAAELWEALGRVSSYPPERSPFLREHPNEAARVAAGVFARLVHHCAKRRKTDFVDSLVGLAQEHAYYPFAGVPLEQAPRPEGLLVRLTPAETITHRFGRWKLRKEFSLGNRSRDLGRIVRGIDRQMRDDWDFGHPLKEQRLPAYVVGMIQKESALERERSQRAERRRISFDLSKLGSIRSAAAITQEALLVDEERGDCPPDDLHRESLPFAPVTASPRMPDESDVASSAGMSRPAATSDTPAPPPPNGAQGRDPMGGPPSLCGLDQEELALLRALLDGRPGPGGTARTTEMLADSANEKLFDLLGDTAIEFDENGPRLIEDYAEDLRGMLEP